MNVATEPHGPAAEEPVAQFGARLRQVRLQSGMSLREAARRLGVSPSFVSQIENGKSQPSVATLYSIAQLLDVSIDELFDLTTGVRPSRAGVGPVAGDTAPPETARSSAGPGGQAPISRSDFVTPAAAWADEPPRRISVTRPGERPRLVMDSGVIWEQLASTAKNVDFMEIIYPAGSRSTTDGRMLRHEGHEYGWLLEGELEVTVGFEIFTLRAGEALGFDPAVPHLFRNLGTVDARGIWCVLHTH